MDVDSLKREQILPIENLLQRKYMHNGINCRKFILPPYNELDYIRVIQRCVEAGLIKENEPVVGRRLDKVRKLVLQEKKS